MTDHAASEPAGPLALTDIGELVTNVPSDRSPLLGAIEGAALVIEHGRIVWLGPQRDLDRSRVARRVSLADRCVTPGFVDSHTHLVFAGDRSDEFEARMAGEPYTGGGIARTVAATRAASDDELRRLAGGLVAEARAQGTTTLEIKSGYALDVAGEARLLRVAREFTEHATFLGAHVVPPEYADRRAAYLDLVTGPMLAACAPLARWIDVFCEPHSPHAFTEDEARRVLRAGAAAGLGLRVHGNQLADGPGARLALELGAASVDHGTFLSDADLAAIGAAPAARRPVVTLLPAVEFSTRSPYPDAARLLAAGVSVALATDCNPGTCFSTSMPFVIALAVREMGLRTDQALWAATRGGALALRDPQLGVLRAGGRADLAVLDAPSHTHLAYRPGVPLAHDLAWALTQGA